MSFHEEKVKKYVKMGCQKSGIGESAFRELVVIKLLEAMGWDDDEITIEEKIPFGTRGGKADYVLRKGNTIIVIEAKPPSQPIEQYYGELTSYMKQLEAQFGFIYNGRKLALFNRSLEGGWDSSPSYFWECGTDIDIFEALSEENIEEKLIKFLEERKNITLLDRTVTDKISDIADAAIGKIQELSGLPVNFIKANVDISVKTARVIRDSLNNGGSAASSSDRGNENFPRTISRKELKDYPDGELVICPSTGEDEDEIGEKFMLAHHAWRAIRINRSPKYFALYQGFPHSKVRWFAKISAIKDVEDPSLLSWYKLPPHYSDEEGKKTILLVPGSEVMLEEPIEKASWGGLRNIAYTTLSKFANARTLEDL